MVVVVQLLSQVQLCNPMNYSTPDFPVLHYLPEFAQIHVHWVNDAMQPSHPLWPQPFPVSRSFPLSRLFTSRGQSIGASASASVLPMNIQGWFLLRLTGLISLQSKELSRVFCNTFRRHQFFSTQPSLWSSSHIRTRLLENHSFDSIDLCWQSDVSAF